MFKNKIQEVNDLKSKKFFALITLVAYATVFVVAICAGIYFLHEGNLSMLLMANVIAFAVGMMALNLSDRIVKIDEDIHEVKSLCYCSWDQTWRNRDEALDSLEMAAVNATYQGVFNVSDFSGEIIRGLLVTIDRERSIQKIETYIEGE